MPTSRIVPLLGVTTFAALFLTASAKPVAAQLVIEPTFDSTWSANSVGTSYSNHVAPLTQIAGRISP